MKLFLYLFIFSVGLISCIPTSNSQNLIINGDFETYMDCPSNNTSFKMPPNSPNHSIPDVIGNWYLVLEDNPNVSNAPSNFKPEYFNKCDTSIYVENCNFVGKFNDSINYVRPMPSDNRGGFIGMNLWKRTSQNMLMDMVFSIRKDFLQTMLSEPLIPGEYYNISFYYLQGFDHFYKECPNEKWYHGPIDRIGFTFSDSFLHTENIGDLLFPNINPIFETPKDQWIESKYNWSKISFNFYAIDAHQVLVFGNFHSSLDYQKFFNSTVKGHYEGYYFFDNFCLRRYNDDYFESVNPSTTIGVCYYDTIISEIFEPDGQLWSTGDTTVGIPVSKLTFHDDTAITWVKTIKDGKLYIDTFILFKNSLHDIFDLDTILCGLEGVTINLKELFPNYSFYNKDFNKFEFGPFLDNQNSQAYKYYYKKNDSCSDDFATFTINVLAPYYPNLIDTLIKCIGDSAVIQLEENFHNAIWNTGAISNSLTVKETGVYSYQFITKCQTIEDSIYVYFKKCEHCIQFPNAFSPNNDGLNDIFKPVHYCPEINQYELQIFDRWGALVFKSYNLQTGWDGTFKGKNADIGIYYFITNYKGNISGPVSSKSGEIHLIR